jgi:hypothetical protein
MEREKAKEQIAAHLKAGLIRVHCKKVIFVGRDQKQREEGDVEPLPGIWAQSYDLAYDQEFWCWETGYFVVLKKPQPRALEWGFYLHGVRFLLEDNEAMLPSIEPAAIAEPAPLTTQAIGRVSDADLRRWVRGKLSLGHTARELIESRKTEFAGKVVPSKRHVEGIYKEEFLADFAEEPKAGSLHPELKERRAKHGLSA